MLGYKLERLQPRKPPRTCFIHHLVEEVSIRRIGQRLTEKRENTPGKSSNIILVWKKATFGAHAEILVTIKRVRYPTFVGSPLTVRGVATLQAADSAQITHISPPLIDRRCHSTAPGPGSRLQWRAAFGMASVNDSFLLFGIGLLNILAAIVLAGVRARSEANQAPPLRRSSSESLEPVQG